MVIGSKRGDGTTLDDTLAALLSPGDAEADSAALIDGRSVQMQRQDTCVAAIAPIATAKEATEGRLVRVRIDLPDALSRAPTAGT